MTGHKGNLYSKFTLNNYMYFFVFFYLLFSTQFVFAERKANTLPSAKDDIITNQEDAHSLVNEAIGVQTYQVIDDLKAEQKQNGTISDESLVKSEIILRDSRDAIQKNEAAQKALQGSDLPMTKGAKALSKEEVKKRHYNAEPLQNENEILKFQKNVDTDEMKRKKQLFLQGDTSLITPKNTEFCAGGDGNLEFVYDQKSGGYYKCKKVNEDLKNAADAFHKDKKYTIMKNAITDKDITNAENRKNNVSDKAIDKMANQNIGIYNEFPMLGTITDGQNKDDKKIEPFFRMPIETIDQTLNDVIYSGNQQNLSDIKTGKDGLINNNKK